MSYATKEQLKDIMSDAGKKTGDTLRYLRNASKKSIRKNLLPYPYASGGSVEENGISFIDNHDGSITIKAGTATDGARYIFFNKTTDILEQGKKYIISGGKESLPTNAMFYIDGSNFSYIASWPHRDNTFTVDYNRVSNISAGIWISKGTVIENDITIYPMIRLDSILDDEWEPYIFDNEQLENKILESRTNILKNTVSPSLIDNEAAISNGYWRVGSGGNGIGSIEEIDDSPVMGFNKTFRITGNTTGNRDFAQKIDIKHLETFKNDLLLTFSCYVRAIDEPCTGLIRMFGYNIDGEICPLSFNASTDWEFIEVPIVFSSPFNTHFYMQFGITGPGNIEYIAPSLVKNSLINDKSINIIGSKNLVPINNSETRKILNGVNIVLNNDGTIILNGTSTSDGGISIVDTSSIIPESGDYILSSGGFISGSVTTGLQSGIYLQKRDANMATKGDYANTYHYDNVKFRADKDTYPYENLGIWFKAGITFNNVVVKPMIRPASISDPTYEPYAMTNRQITKVLNVNSDSMPSYVARSLPIRFKDITDEFYNGNLRTEIAAGNFANVRVGDYILGKTTGTRYYVADMDGRLGKGDQTNNTNYPAYGTHHLNLMLFKVTNTSVTRLWAGYGRSNKSWTVSANDRNRCPWNAATDADPTSTTAVGSDNTNITRTYAGASVSGYMGSFIRERIDTILLPECFQADFGESNVLKYREIHGKGVNTDAVAPGVTTWKGCTSEWEWFDRYLDLPSEVELYGTRVFSGAFDVGCQCEQLPLFRNAHIHDAFPRLDPWTKGVASSSNAAHRNDAGRAHASGASNANWACPLACVK